MTGRFGPVDADDLLGTASARLLAVGLERRERLAALRLLGLLADHAGADQRIRRHIDDLVAEFGIDPDGVDTSLAALVMAEVLRIDLDTGSMILIVPSRPAAGGLRAESFLANVARSLDTEPTDELAEPVAPRTSVDAPPARTPAVARAARLLNVVQAGATVRSLVPRQRRQAAAPKAGSDDIEIATIHHIPVVLVEPPGPRHRRPFGAAAASLVAAVATLVLGASPDFEQQTASLPSEAAVADRPDEVRRLTTTTVGRPATPPSTTNEPGTVARSAAEEVTADEVEQSTTARARVPRSTAPEPEQRTTTRDRRERPEQDPGPGPVVEVPCAPETPVLEVLRISTNETGAPIGQSVGGVRVAVVRGTAHNSLGEAVVIDAFDVEVLLRDGSTVVARRTGPILLAADQSATWFVEVPIGASDPHLATAHLARWAHADGDPTDAAECTPEA